MHQKQERRPSLTYASGGGGLSERRYWGLLALTLLNTLLLTATYLQPLWIGAKQWLEERRAARVAAATILASPSQAAPLPQALLAEQAKWMEYNPTINQVVYEEDPDAARRLLRQPDYQALDLTSLETTLAANWRGPAMFVPAISQEFQPLTTGSTVLLHSLISPSGYVRLVHITFSAKPKLDVAGNGFAIRSEARFSARVMFPGSDTTSPRRLNDHEWMLPDRVMATTTSTKVDASLRFNSHEELRVFAAQRDRSDFSSFTIRVQVGGADRLIHGALSDDDKVRLVPPEGMHWQAEGGGY